MFICFAGVLAELGRWGEIKSVADMRQEVDEYMAEHEAVFTRLYRVTQQEGLLENGVYVGDAELLALCLKYRVNAHVFGVNASKGPGDGTVYN